jgi:hypothetical protein
LKSCKGILERPQTSTTEGTVQAKANTQKRASVASLCPGWCLKCQKAGTGENTATQAKTVSNRILGSGRMMEVCRQPTIVNIRKVAKANAA